MQAIKGKISEIKVNPKDYKLGRLIESDQSLLYQEVARLESKNEEKIKINIKANAE